MQKTRQLCLGLLASAGLAALAGAPPQGKTGPARASRAPKKVVLVELFTSQGCDSCPSAEQVFGRIKEMGSPPDRVVPIAFHVDYFDRPWKDPLSDPLYSRREYQYSLIYQRQNQLKDPNALYFTPMLMVDGRFPMLGSDRAKARRAIEQALAEQPGVALDLGLEEEGGPRRKRLRVTLSEPSLRFEGRRVLVGVATFEETVTTKVKAGENAGKTLVEHFAARRLAVEPATPSRAAPTRLSFPVELDPTWDAARFGLAVYVQDEATGYILQAASIRWKADPGPS
jgi:hypothetical protein